MLFRTSSVYSTGPGMRMEGWGGWEGVLVAMLRDCLCPCGRVGGVEVVVVVVGWVVTKFRSME